ncbi:unnamed protein product [Caenorhabditis angaria]|uniref:Moesin/ezrin/radixin homolog 1 n=1 Tax=Caenorhabditis angaria TaxID=860376 RepID=A0A9P1MYX5_9PELO|nr:unnamed protein product [Caenorhabditis angaria]
MSSDEEIEDTSENVTMSWMFRTLSARFSRNRNPPRNNAPQNSHSSSSVTEPSFDTKKFVQCKVLLLDGAHLNIVVPRNAQGAELYEEVFYSLDLEERDYFGLQFTDHYNVQHWLDPSKKVVKQVAIGPPFTLRFRVKFFTSEPSSNLKEELTRYQFFLQIKSDVSTGRLACPAQFAVDLAALALQSELGDYNPIEHTPMFISEFRFHPEQDEKMEIEILEKYKLCRGQTPAQAELNYLNKARWIEMYGVDMHTVEGKDGNTYRLGLTPQGMLVFDGNQKIGLFLWEKLQKLDFKNKKITLVVEEDADMSNNGQIQLHTFVFNLISEKAAKHFWKCAIEQHAFFRLKSKPIPTGRKMQFFRLGSTFKYRGRTEYETVHKEGARLSRRQSCSFERRPSQRYGPRQSHLTNAQIREAKRAEIRQQIEQQREPAPPLPPAHQKVIPIPEPKISLNNNNVIHKSSPDIAHVTKICVGTLEPPSHIPRPVHVQQTPSVSKISRIPEPRKYSDQNHSTTNIIEVAPRKFSQVENTTSHSKLPTRMVQPMQLQRRIVTDF